MLGGMFSVYFLSVLGLPLPVAVCLAVAATTVVGLLMERFTIRPVKNPSIIQLVIITIGVSIVIRGVAMLVWGKDTHALPAFTGTKPIALFGATLVPQSLWVLGISLLMLLALRAFFTRTAFGKGMLACSYDPKAAYLAGISVERMILFSFMISGLIGAVGGAILAPITLTSYDVGIMLGLKGFAACILGGLGNPFGAAAGGVIIGVLESFGSGFISSAYKDAFAFIILLMLLFLKPSGLFGAKSAERV